MEAAATVSSTRKRSSADKSRGRRSKVGESEHGTASSPSGAAEVCGDNKGAPPPVASKVPHSTARQGGVRSPPRRSENAGRNETFGDNQQEETEAVQQQSVQATSAVVAPQVLPSAPLDAPNEVHGGGYAESKESRPTEMASPAPQEMPSAPVDIGGETVVGCAYGWEEIKTNEPTAPPTFLTDSYDDPCGFPATHSAPTTQAQLSNHQVTTSLAPTACGFDVLGRSRDIGRHYPEISGIFDHRAAATPLSEDQVLRLYGGTWLTRREEVVAEFVSLNQEKNLNSHALYVLLANYLRARQLLSETTSLVEKFRDEVAKCESLVWDMKSASVTVTGTCGDGRAVSATRHFNRAEYNSRVASRLASCSQQMLTLLKERHVVYMHNVGTLKVQIDYHIQLVVGRAPLGNVQNSTPIIFKVHPGTKV
ncbi:hypothetical protein HPB50_017632 [Hyalomma asiaticum]|uniref:Uncharacterized protein n=1 Tax=Hyalomma asiaticum TaxID=266040 RepID=A0ACB7RJZ5_HYAAI|nr:hypothetical protein HPB50_017632 [Hyalomma asiaticum]